MQNGDWGIRGKGLREKERTERAEDRGVRSEKTGLRDEGKCRIKNAEW
jgi:hypothetical protein